MSNVSAKSYHATTSEYTNDTRSMGRALASTIQCCIDDSGSVEFKQHSSLLQWFDSRDNGTTYRHVDGAGQRYLAFFEQ